MDWTTNWLTDWISDWLNHWLAGWGTESPTGWLTGWIARRPNHWLTDWITGWLVTRSLACLVTHLLLFVMSEQAAGVLPDQCDGGHPHRWAGMVQWSLWVHGAQLPIPRPLLWQRPMPDHALWDGRKWVICDLVQMGLCVSWVTLFCGIMHAPTTLHTHMHTCTHTCIHTHTYTHLHTLMYTYWHKCTPSNTCVCILICTCTHTDTCTSVYSHTHTHSLSLSLCLDLSLSLSLSLSLLLSLFRSFMLMLYHVTWLEWRLRSADDFLI